MVSSTQQHDIIRRRKRATNGKKGKAERRKGASPPFPIHPVDPAQAAAKK